MPRAPHLDAHASPDSVQFVRDQVAQWRHRGFFGPAIERNLLRDLNRRYGKPPSPQPSESEPAPARR